MLRQDPCPFPLPDTFPVPRPSGSRRTAPATPGPCAVGLVLAAILSGCASQGPMTAVAYMPSGERVDPPSGFADLCRREPQNCRPLQHAREVVVELTAERRLLLEDVNRRVNRGIEDATDLALYGREEFWVNPLGGGGAGLRGDCEDYALAKRDMLIERGWPSDALFLAVGYHQRLGLHAVLIARTSDGDLVLDARSPWLHPFEDAPYVWVKRQLASHSADWVRTYPARTAAELRGEATATTGRPLGGRAGETR